MYCVLEWTCGECREQGECAPVSCRPGKRKVDQKPRWPSAVCLDVSERVQGTELSNVLSGTQGSLISVTKRSTTLSVFGGLTGKALCWYAIWRRWKGVFNAKPFTCQIAIWWKNVTSYLILDLWCFKHQRQAFLRTLASIIERPYRFLHY